MNAPPSLAAPEPPVAAPAESPRVARRTVVMHLADTLDVGGAERMVVNLANALPRDRFAAHVCTTRRLGPLARFLAPDVGLISLDRRRRFDVRALPRLAAYVRTHGIEVLHAHGMSLYTALAVSALVPGRRIVWHVHHGRQAIDGSRGWAYRPVRRWIDETIAVSEGLARWAVARVGLPAAHVHYVPNFVARPHEPFGGAAPQPAPALPGVAAARLACVANLLPVKDQLTLVRAMRRVVDARPEAHLLLVGGPSDVRYAHTVRDEIAVHRLEEHVTLLGDCADVRGLLAQVDVGVLSSRAEGMPLALLEYGTAGLAVVTTDVGQCGDVVAGGEAGRLVTPGDVDGMAAALLELLGADALRARLGRALQARVAERFTARVVVARVAELYEALAGVPR